MSDKPEFELLIEIAKLLKKYGPEAFESLAQGLSSPEFSERLASILTASARIGRSEQKKAESKRMTKDFRLSVIELGETEPEKSALLLTLYDSLMAKTLLPTLREIQIYVSDMGLPPVKVTTRDKTIVPLIKTLMNLPINELKDKLSVIKPVSTQDDRSLEGWSNIILDKAQKANQGPD